MTEIPLHLKLKKYLDDNGIRTAWFAEKLGINRETLRKVLDGRRNLPPKCWRKVVELTKGKITMKEILNNFLDDAQDADD